MCQLYTNSIFEYVEYLLSQNCYSAVGRYTSTIINVLNFVFQLRALSIAKSMLEWDKYTKRSRIEVFPDPDEFWFSQNRN